MLLFTDIITHYKKIYFKMNSTANTYITGDTFFALPLTRWKNTYEINPIAIPSEIL